MWPAACTPPAAMIEGKRIVAVGGGKGGVGKSVVACNLAVGYALAGKATVLVDADLGAPNLHTLLGADLPEATVGDLLEDSSIHLGDLLVPTRVPGLQFAHGAAPILGVANPKFQQKQRLIRELQRLQAEVLVVDLGAGVSYNVVDFFIEADVKIAVVAPQITSMHNAYGFIKSSLHRLLQRAIAAKPGYESLFKSAGATEQRISQLFERVEKYDPSYLAVFEPLVSSFSVYLLGNMLENERELNVIRAMQRMVRDFLWVEATVAGGVFRDPRVADSVNKRRPFMLDHGRGASGEVIRRLVAATLALDLGPQRELLRIAASRAKELPKERGNGASDTPVPEVSRNGEGHFETELRGRQRSEPRYPCEQSVMVRVGKGERAANLVDLSRSGARLEGLPALEPGAKLRARLPGKEGGWIWLTAEVRYYDVADRALGCHFEDVSEAARDALNGLVSSLAARSEPLAEEGVPGPTEERGAVG